MTAEHQLFNFILILARVSAFVGFLPIFAQRQLPHLVKAGLAMSLTVFWFGALPQELFYVNQIDIVVSVLFLAKEITIGFLLAMLLGFMFVQAKIAGAYVGQEVGPLFGIGHKSWNVRLLDACHNHFRNLCRLTFFRLKSAPFPRSNCALLTNSPCWQD